MGVYRLGKFLFCILGPSRFYIKLQSGFSHSHSRYAPQLSLTTRAQRTIKLTNFHQSYPNLDERSARMLSVKTMV